MEQTKINLNKTVLLRDRKRCNAHGKVTTPGVPPSCLGGTPYPALGVPLVLSRGTPKTGQQTGPGTQPWTGPGPGLWAGPGGTPWWTDKQTENIIWNGCIFLSVFKIIKQCRWVWRNFPTVLFPVCRLVIYSYFYSEHFLNLPSRFFVHDRFLKLK